MGFAQLVAGKQPETSPAAKPWVKPLQTTPAELTSTALSSPFGGPVAKTVAPPEHPLRLHCSITPVERIAYAVVAATASFPALAPPTAKSPTATGQCPFQHDPTVHLLPHEPQLFESAMKSMHCAPQAHCCPLAHACEHEPQLALSLLKLTHPPLHALGKLAAQTKPHAPFVHVGWAFGVVGHAWPQEPQLLLSVCVLMHAFPQKFGFALVGQAHAPDWHVSGPGHARPQAPQLLLSVCVLVHVAPHKVGVVAFGQTQPPAVQLCTDGQEWEHVPQLLVSVWVSVHVAPQSVGFAAFGHTQPPALQLCMDGHA